MLNRSNFDDVVSGDKPVLVDFYATWCGPCQMMAPIVEELASEAKDFSVAKVDIDQAPELAAKFNVLGVPTFIIFVGGKKVDHITSATTKELLLEKIQAVMKK